MASGTPPPPPLSSQSDSKLLPGFNNEFSSEALPGALPIGQNSPQRCPYDLYAEQLSGTAFTAPRDKNKRSWLYRIRPSVLHKPFTPIESGTIVSDWTNQVIDPNQLRWAPPPLLPEPGAVEGPEQSKDFIQGLVTMAGAGDPVMKQGVAIHMYTANVSMQDKAFVNADGDFLIVPETGDLEVQTELGVLTVTPREIVVVPRGMRFSIKLQGSSRGYVLELYEGHFELPNLGPIGSNCLANARDFLSPSAHFEDRECEFELINKFGGKLFRAEMDHSPFDVVAWHGNYVPFKYDLSLFCCLNSVTFDHPDPSIYTVMTAPTATPGVAACDFVVFPPRWMVMEHTFRPPWYHRNCMSEFMGMIYGKYDAKVGFVPGGASLHSCMTPHGPDAPTFDKASTEDLAPVKFDGGLAFMFESTYVLKLTQQALDAPYLDTGYQECWQTIPKKFTGRP